MIWTPLERGLGEEATETQPRVAAREVKDKGEPLETICMETTAQQKQLKKKKRNLTY